MMIIQPLFPTVIAKFDLDPPLTEKEKTILYNLETRNNTYNKSSVETSVLENSDLRRLKDFFTFCINQYLNEIIIPDTKCELYITQSWTNYTEQYQQHHRHNHPNSIVSGVFYINVDENRDRISFYKKEETQIRIHSKIFNDLNSNLWWIPVKNNLLILFPSNIDHEVLLVTEGDIRVSLSFNTFVKGVIGSKGHLDQLILGENNGESI